MKPPRTIADLPPSMSIRDIRFIYPGDGQKYYWHSQWHKGVWGKKEIQSEKIFPLFCNKLEDAIKWELAE